MADRLLRDEIWQSDRFLDLPTDACRLTFVRMLSEADDFGNLEGGPKRLYRMLAGCTQIKSEAATVTTLEALIEADLIRLYKVDGRDLIHVPRFRSKRWYFARKVPASPWCDETVALGKTERSEKQALSAKVGPSSDNVGTTLVQRSVNVGEGVGVGVGEKTKTARKRAASSTLVCVSDLIAEGVEQQDATDWLVSRKAKDLPLTRTAWKQTKDEAKKAGMTPAQAIKTAAGNSWAGFKASWVLADRKASGATDHFAGAL